MQTELFFAGCGKREQNTDCRAFCAPLQEQRAAVELDDLLHERQAEARAAPPVVQRGKAAEFRKRLGQRLAVHAFAAVGNGDHGVLFVPRQLQQDRAAARRVFQCIGEQLADGRTQTLSVDPAVKLPRGELFPQRDAKLGAKGFQLLAEAVEIAAKLGLLAPERQFAAQSAAEVAQMAAQAEQPVKRPLLRYLP